MKDSVSILYRISCASHTATKSTSLNYGEKQSPPQSRTALASGVTELYFPAPSCFSLNFLTHAAMHMHFKRIFIMLSPAFLCVLHECFSAVLVTIIARTGSPGALSEGDRRSSTCLQKPSLGTKNQARSPQVTSNFNCVNKSLAHPPREQGMVPNHSLEYLPSSRPYHS